MNTFNKKSLCAALAAFGAAGAAHAVNVSNDGLGEVLIYPYYTVRNAGGVADGNPYNTLISVVNSTESAKAVKVRFIEGKNSQEVLDFNLYLSKNDVWTAAVVPTAEGAKLVVGDTADGVKDTSCTLPNVVDGKEFVNFAYLQDKGGTSLDRTREGYIEIIEMGAIRSGSTLESAVTHVDGKPGQNKLDCTYVTNITAGASSTQIVGVSGGLFGSGALINVLGGAMVGVDPTVLDSFATGVSLKSNSGAIDPDLSSVTPKESIVIGKNNTIYNSFWTNPGDLAVDPVSAVLMHDQILNEYVVSTGLAALTDWVVTMPTKRKYIAVGPGNNAGKLFQKNFNSTAGSCDDIEITLFDREERTIQEVDFSPPPPGGNALCWEANVVTFNSGNLLGSVNSANVDTPFATGWARITFSDVAQHQLANEDTDITSPSGASPSETVTYLGLPVIGFAVTRYANGTLANNVLSNYGESFAHKLTRTILTGN